MPSLKNIARRLVYSSAESRFIYETFWHRLWRLTQLASRQHHWSQLQLGEELNHAAKALKNNPVVNSGPFAGLSYKEVLSSGSTYPPKLLGCYEQELHPAVEQMIASSPPKVIDIGCAEGYYAVGMARRLPDAQVIAYDTNNQAQEQCRILARNNGVEPRVLVKSTCRPEDLIQLRGEPVAIISDCEGGEDQLFEGRVVDALHNAALIIECHDFIKPRITQRLRQRFANSHDVEIVHSIPDHLRPTVLPQFQISSLPRDIQLALMAETRPAFMNWLVCRPRLRSV